MGWSVGMLWEGILDGSKVAENRKTKSLTGFEKIEKNKICKKKKHDFAKDKKTKLVNL